MQILKPEHWLRTFLKFERTYIIISNKIIHAGVKGVLNPTFQHLVLN